MKNKALVGIAMGSDSDWPVMKKAADVLEELGIAYEKRVVSAHRTPDDMAEYGKSAASRGLRVIVAGLDMDYRGLPFGPMPSLMATAETVTKMSAICTACGSPASRSQRLEGSNERSQILVGADEIYEPRCRRCFEPPLD